MSRSLFGIKCQNSRGTAVLYPVFRNTERRFTPTLTLVYEEVFNFLPVEVGKYLKNIKVCVNKENVTELASSWLCEPNTENLKEVVRRQVENLVKVEGEVPEEIVEAVKRLVTTVCTEIVRKFLREELMAKMEEIGLLEEIARYVKETIES